MKTLTIALSIIFCIGFASCEKTSKVTSKSSDTVVIKKDSMVTKTDTTGFYKK